MKLLTLAAPAFAHSPASNPTSAAPAEIALKPFAAQRDYMTHTDALEQPNPRAAK